MTANKDANRGDVIDFYSPLSAFIGKFRNKPTMEVAMKITNESIAVNSLKSVNANAIGENKTDRQPISEDNYNNAARFDRYEGISAGHGAISLINNSNPADKGIFSENTSIEMGDRILKSQEIFDRSAPDGFSAKHIVSAFFRAEGGNRYSVGVNYEIADKLGTAPWIIDHGKANLAWAIEKEGFNEDCVATIASQVGKYIDHCYKNGKYTDEEYAQLNDEIRNCSKYWLDCITDKRVGKRLREEDAKLYFNTRVLVEPPRRTAEDYLADRIRMRKIIEAENPFDINAFFEKVNQMRFNVTGIKETSAERGSADVKSETK